MPRPLRLKPPTHQLLTEAQRRRATFDPVEGLYRIDATDAGGLPASPLAAIGVVLVSFQPSRTDIELATAIVDFLLSFGIRKEIREYELLCLSAEDRYTRLLTQTPELLDRVTQNEIARYLGVTPVGLSRIKSRLKDSP